MDVPSLGRIMNHNNHHRTVVVVIAANKVPELLIPINRPDTSSIATHIGCRFRVIGLESSKRIGNIIAVHQPAVEHLS
jgi:hypothetical protein